MRVSAGTADTGAQGCPTLEFSDVLAARSRLSRSWSSTGVESSSRNCTAFFAALANDSAMMVGWMPFASSFSAAPSMLPARTTTDVVPSPASTSWAAERSTSFGCDVQRRGRGGGVSRRDERQEREKKNDETDHPCGRVHDAEVLEDGGAVVGDDGLSVLCPDHLVHATRAERGPDAVRDGCRCVCANRGSVLLPKGSCLRCIFPS